MQTWIRQNPKRPRLRSKPLVLVVNDSNAKAAPEDDAANFLQAPKYAKMTQTDDMGIVIVDDDIQIDQERINEERRAYLEEARSQEAFD